MYNALAPLYDALFEDIESSQLWVDLVKRNTTGNQILELACGSGDIAHLLSEQGFDVLATDISNEMLEAAKHKYPSLTIGQLDMCELSEVDTYDAITCFCDSLNYIIKEDQLITHFKQVYTALHVGGSYIFDVHSLDRKEEFAEVYVESGIVEEVDYQWEIIADGDKLYQQFAFYYPQGTRVESHVQVIWEPQFIKSQLELIGFEVSWFTDFDQEGIVEGEKYFFVAKKVR